MVTPAVPADLKGASAAIPPLEFEIFLDQTGTNLGVSSGCMIHCYKKLFSDREVRQTSGDERCCSLLGTGSVCLDQSVSKSEVGGGIEFMMLELSPEDLKGLTV